MNNVYMIEYQGRCDENAVAVGHAPKVITEYYNFIKDFCNVHVYAPSTILNSVDSSLFANKKELKCHIVMKGKTPFIEKITNKLNMFKNLREAIEKANENGPGILWFFNVEYYIMLYFLFAKKPAHKVVLTMFIDGYKPSKNASIKTKFVNGIKHKVFELAQKKIDIIISTGKSFQYKNCHYEFIPDYYYIDSIYDQYKNTQKENMAVCLGTMGRGKQLPEMVEAFNRIGYPLTIAGRFYDKELFKSLSDSALENITLKDTYLSNEEYLSLLAKAKYTILPYPKENYSHQTSGVMQEAVFLRTVPVTYSSILEGNCTDGLGFSTWDALTADMLSTPVDSIIEKYETEISTTYSYASVSTHYREIFG